MTATPPRFRHRLEAAAARLLFARLAQRDIDTASAFGGRLARRIGPLTGAHRTAERNLALAFPSWTDQARRAVLTDAWDNFGRTMTEYAALPRLWRDGWQDRITVRGNDALAACARAGQAGAAVLRTHRQLGDDPAGPVAGLAPADHRLSPAE